MKNKWKKLYKCSKQDRAWVMLPCTKFYPSWDISSAVEDTFLCAKQQKIVFKFEVVCKEEAPLLINTQHPKTKNILYKQMAIAQKMNLKSMIDLTIAIETTTVDPRPFFVWIHMPLSSIMEIVIYF